MATFAPSPAAETSSASNDADLGSLIASSFDEVNSEDTTEQAVEDEGGDPTSQDDAKSESEVDPNAAAEGPFKLSEDGQHYLVPKTELAAYTGMKQFNEQVQGMFPTLGDAQTAHQMAQNLQLIDADYTSGDPKNIDAVLRHFAGMNEQDPYMRETYESAFLQLANRAPEILKTVNPGAYAKLTNTITQSAMTPKIESAYQSAAEVLASKGKDSQEYKTAIYAAQVLDFNTNGKYDSAPRPKQVQPQANAVDPRLAEVEKRENSLLERDFTTFNTSQLDGPKWQQFESEIDKVLEPIKGKFSPEVFDGIRMKVSRDVMAKIKEDQAFASQHTAARQRIQTQFNSMWKNRQDPAALKDQVTRYHNDLLVRERRILPSIVAPLLQGATAKAVAQSKTSGKPQAQARPQNSQPSQQAPKQQQSKLYDRKEDPEWAALWR